MSATIDLLHPVPQTADEICWAAESMVHQMKLVGEGVAVREMKARGHGRWKFQGN